MSFFSSVKGFFSSSSMLFAGCISASAFVFSAPADASDDSDPWEGFNRKVFAFNDYMDRNLLKPVAQGYEFVTRTL